LRLRTLLLALLAAPLLSACIYDGAAYEVDGTREHVLSLVREQPYFWDIKIGKKMFATETQTCESWAKISGEPEGGMGTLKGTFRLKKGELVFVKEASEGEAGADKA